MRFRLKATSTSIQYPRKLSCALPVTGSLCFDAAALALAPSFVPLTLSSSLTSLPSPIIVYHPRIDRWLHWLLLIDWLWSLAAIPPLFRGTIARFPMSILQEQPCKNLFIVMPNVIILALRSKTTRTTITPVPA
ncbi:hypothetical protein CLAIMM_03922 [Cladophialophora immunda]|nr:hypothetical protein CLAIMM_03922 [Cladophialophora immunda]